MVQKFATDMASLYESDETAWLDSTAELLRNHRFEELDVSNLAEYLSDMAKRDRREVYSRLVVLLAHLLKWEHQPDRRTPSWQLTILEQQRELKLLLQSGTLRKHASTVLLDTYLDACKIASVETGLDEGSFPQDCAWSVDAALVAELR